MAMRIRPTSGFLLDIVREARAGQVVPAAFQRPYVWTRDDVEALWTSLLNGWPIGSFLLWTPPEGTPINRVGRGRLGPIAASEDQWASMILDGQNRLATLAWSMLLPGGERPPNDDLSGQERETWDPAQVLVADYETRSVRFVPANEATSGVRMPVGVLLDGGAFLRSLRTLQIPEALFDDVVGWLDGAANAVREARATVTLIERATPEQAVEAFRHVARVGQPVSAEDVERALSWSQEQAPQVPGRRA